MSMSKHGLVVSAIICFALTGCVTNEVIVAGAVDTLGVSVSGGTTDQGGNMVVGFKGAKVAVVPVQTESGQLLATPDGPNKERGFSVLALLGVDVAGGLSTGAGVHQVLAVGRPADLWALGQAKNKP
jgi:hypothetical protein